MNKITPVTEYRFQVGQIVRHHRYGYRGVIYEVDPVCRASEEWHQNNQTQPDRHQPWYHVIVDGARHTTYVAESNLQLDFTGKPITHPLVRRLFPSFYRGRYSRENLN